MPYLCRCDLCGDVSRVMCLIARQLISHPASCALRGAFFANSNSIPGWIWLQITRPVTRQQSANNHKHAKSLKFVKEPAPTLRAPGGLGNVRRSDFWIWRGAPEVVRLVLVLLLQEPAPTLRVPGGLVKVRRSDFKRNVCVLITEPRSVRDLVAVGSCGTCYSMLLCSMPCSRFVTDPGDPPFDHLQGTGGPKGQSRT